MHKYDHFTHPDQLQHISYPEHMTKSIMLKWMDFIPVLTDTHFMNNKSKKINHISFRISDLEVNPD